jgi:hypothetical protein
MALAVATGRGKRGSLLIAAAIGAAASLAVTGFVFPKNNDLFYYSVISNLSSDVQFRNDVFVNSLSHFSSGLWLALRGAPDVVNPYWLFLILDVLSRILTFVGALACADLLGVRSLSQRLVFSLVFAASFLMSQDALAGAGGLFIDNFTHTEVDNGLFLASLALAVRRKTGASIVVLGLMAFFNAFFAVWAVFPLAAVVAWQGWRGELRPSRLAVQVAAGGAVAAVLAAPVALSVLQNRGYGSTSDFDYLAYLQSYYPNHFLFGSITLPQKAGLLAIVAVTFLSLATIGGFARAFAAAAVGAVAVYLVGILAPLVTHSQTVLNLHLLRSSVLIHLLCATSTAALATGWLSSPDRRDALFRGLCWPSS